MTMTPPHRTFKFMDDAARTTALIEDTRAAYPTATTVVFRWLTWHDESYPEPMHVLDAAGRDLATDDDLQFITNSAYGLSLRIGSLAEWKAKGDRGGYDWFELEIPAVSRLQTLKRGVQRATALFR